MKKTCQLTTCLFHISYIPILLLLHFQSSHGKLLENGTQFITEQTQPRKRANKEEIYNIKTLKPTFGGRWMTLKQVTKIIWRKTHTKTQTHCWWTLNTQTGDQNNMTQNSRTSYKLRQAALRIKHGIRHDPEFRSNKKASGDHQSKSAA